VQGVRVGDYELFTAVTNRKALAPTPPMGWNSFDCFGGQAREEDIRANADYMVKHLRNYGWEYVVIDIAWYAEYSDPNKTYAIESLYMDQHGRLIPSPTLYPSSVDGVGLRSLADYLHSMDMKLGIHIMRGIPQDAVKRNLPILGSTALAGDIANAQDVCPWWNGHMYGIDSSKDGAQQYYDSIVKLYSDWGVDFIKADDMSCPYHRAEIEMLRKSIDRCGREMLLSLSPGPSDIANAEHIKANSEMWRLSGDVWDLWKNVLAGFELAELWNSHRGPNNWPDLDMLPLGRLELRPAEDGAEYGFERWSRLSRDEQLTTMTLWVIFRSPLMFGGHLPANDGWTESLLTNEEVLNITKDSRNNSQLYRTEDEAVWSAEGDDCRYLALFNLSDRTASVEAALKQMQMEGRWQVRDLWCRTDLGAVSSAVTAEIAPHGSKLFRLSPIREGSEDV